MTCLWRRQPSADSDSSVSGINLSQVWYPWYGEDWLQAASGNILTICTLSYPGNHHNYWHQHCNGTQLSGSIQYCSSISSQIVPPPLLNKSNLYNLGATPKKIYVILEWRSGLKSIIKYTALIYQLTQAFKWRISSDLRLNGAFMSLYIFFSLVRIHIICWNILSPGPPIICSCNTLSLPYSLLKLISFAMTCSLTTKNMSYGRL